MRRFLLRFLLVLGGLFLGSNILAQGFSIGISPLVFEINGTPGDIIENQIQVYNPLENTTIGVKMTAEDIAPSGEEGHVMVEPAETETYSLAKWIKIEPEELILEPKESKWVKFTITVPQNAEPGGHYGTIVAGGKMTAGMEASGATLVPRVGSLILLTVPGEMKENLSVIDFNAPQYSERGPINFDIRFENKGTVHVKPKGLITITNWLGQKVAAIPFPEKNVLPGGVRKIEATWNQKWLLGGKYTATLTGNYGIGNFQLSPVVISFWAFPWKLGLIIFAILVFIILIRKRLRAALRIIIKGEK